MKKTFLWAVAACMLFAKPVMAKEGFYLGVFLPNSTISGDAGTGTSSGKGWGVRAGLGLNRYIAIEADYTATKHDVTGGAKLDLKGLAGDVKLHFPLTSLDRAQVMTLEPYILIGYDHVEAAGSSQTFKSDGVQYGVGLELYLFHELSVSAGWTKTAVSFDTTPKTEGDIKTIDFGITYHFI
jgi:outer membrane protein with beta-barrel domain